MIDFEKASRYLLLGLRTIEEYGWIRSDSAGNTAIHVVAIDGVNGSACIPDRDGSCIYGGRYSCTCQCKCLALSVGSYPGGLYFVRKALGLPDTEPISTIYRINDSQLATHEGRLWAIGVLKDAIQLTKAMDGESAHVDA